MLTDSFFAVLRLSLYGAGATVLVWLACTLLRRLRAPRAICCALWLAVPACLLLPTGIPLVLPRRAAAPAAFSGAMGRAQALFTAAAVPAPIPMPANTPLSFSWQQLLAAAWLAGAAALALHALWADFRLRHKVAQAYRVDDAGRPYYTGACVNAPFVAGLLRPRIYLPTGLSPHRRQPILLHEQAHLDRHDNWTKPLFFAAVCLHWFNPFIWLAYREMVLDMEAACDEAVLRRLGSAAKSDYCESLLQFALRNRLADPLAFGESSTKARIHAILAYHRPRFWAVAGGIVLAAAVAVACLLRPVGADVPIRAFTPDSTQSEFIPASPAGDKSSTAASSQSESLPTENTPQNALAAQSPAAEQTALDTDNTAGTPVLTSLLPALEAAAAGDSTAGGEAFLWPVPAYRNCSRWMSNGHRGADISAATGSEILAAADGIVLVAGYNGNPQATAQYATPQESDGQPSTDADGQPLTERLYSGYGNLLLIDHGNGVKTLYSHCDTLAVTAGTSVTRGQVIATVGNSGRSTGSHLHWEIWTGSTDTSDGALYDPHLLFPNA